MSITEFEKKETALFNKINAGVERDEHGSLWKQIQRLYDEFYSDLPTDDEEECKPEYEEELLAI